MSDDEVGGGEDFYRGGFVDRLTCKVAIGEAGELGDPQVEGPLRILAPDPWRSDLDDPAEFVEAEALDGEFDDHVRLAIKTGRLDIERDTDPKLSLRRTRMKAFDRHQSPKHPKVRVRGESTRGVSQ